MATVELQSQEHRNLLDIIDKLRSQGIDRYVDLPQIVVCGDQSAGKSSVLEAISGMPFPTKDSLCTRFATELILRRSPAVSIKVSINPDKGRPEAEQHRLRSFSPGILDPERDFAEVVEKSKGAMGLGKGDRSFSSDVLRVELSGPSQPHLTLVDLPGLFEAGSKDQSEEDAEMVKDLVLGYMTRPRSIILAVVSAKSDFNIQSVTKHTRKLDPEGMRTLGLITKPDKLEEGSPSEQHYVRLANNEDVYFRLGWHVLRNRDYREKGSTSAERDGMEELFFSQGIWPSVSPARLGVANLRTRLSNVLKDQIVQQLPGLVQDVKAGILSCELRLGNLGPPRSSAEEQRKYLGRVSEDFSRLMQAAIDGTYTHAFFGSSETDDGYRRRLRTFLQNRLLDFGQKMRDHGHEWTIVEYDTEGELGSFISRSDFADRVKDLIRRNRGRELPGLFNPIIIMELFQEQCQPWRDIVDSLTDDVLRCVSEVIEKILRHIAVPDTADAILQEILNPELARLDQDLAKKVDELLAPHRDIHPITYNPSLRENVRKAEVARKVERYTAVVKSKLGIDSLFADVRRNYDFAPMIEALADEEEDEDMDRRASMKAIDYMEAYYKVELMKAVDDISVLAIEQRLVQKLPSLLSLQRVFSLSGTDIERLAAERPEVVADRSRTASKLKILQEGLQGLRRLGGPRGHVDFLPTPTDSETDLSNVATPEFV